MHYYRSIHSRRRRTHCIRRWQSYFHRHSPLSPALCYCHRLLWNRYSVCPSRCSHSRRHSYCCSHHYWSYYYHRSPRSPLSFHSRTSGRRSARHYCRSIHFPQRRTHCIHRWQLCFRRHSPLSPPSCYCRISDRLWATHHRRSIHFRPCTYLSTHHYSCCYCHRTLLQHFASRSLCPLHSDPSRGRGIRTQSSPS